MKGILAMGFAAAGLLAATAAPAQDAYRPPSAAERKAFETCLFAYWVEDYCESSYLFYSPGSNKVRACVIANGGGRFPLARYRGWSAEDYCRSTITRGRG